MSGAIRCVLPAFSLMEPYPTLDHRSANRNRVRNDLAPVLRELGRTALYTHQVKAAETMLSPILVDSETDELSRLNLMRRRLLHVTETIPLDAEILARASGLEASCKLSAQDAVVLASVCSHLGRHRPARSCFLNRNRKDFDKPEITNELKPYGCKLFFHFDLGLQYIRHEIARPAPS